MADESMSADDTPGKHGSDKHCCVPVCNGNGRRNPELSFHRIPKDEALRKQWIRAIRRDPGPLFHISKETVVCSKHFKREDFKCTPVRKTLLSTSVPSIFEWGKPVTVRRELIRSDVPVKKVKILQEEDNTQTPTSEDHCTEIDHQEKENICVFDELAEAKEKIAELEAKLKVKDEEINKLTQKIEIERFGVVRYTHDNDKMQFFTGFTSVSMFYAFFNYVKPTAQSMTSYYYKSSGNLNINVGRQRNMLLIE